MHIWISETIKTTRNAYIKKDSSNLKKILLVYHTICEVKRFESSILFVTVKNSIHQDIVKNNNYFVHASICSKISAESLPKIL